MPWDRYWGILRRRWLIIVAVILLDVLVSGYLFAKSYRHAGYQGCVTLYVADVGAPSLISAPSDTLDTAGQLLAGETAANFFADDILDVAQSQRVAAAISRTLREAAMVSRALRPTLSNIAAADINGSISGSRRDRTVTLCDTNPNQASALAIAGQLGNAMTSGRAQFVGAAVAKRVFVKVISSASVGAVSASHQLLNFALRVILGILVAAGLALLWDALDPAVRDRRDLAATLGVPVIAL